MPDLKILTSHPVQYYVPFYKTMVDEGLDIEVGYYHPGAAGQVAHDAGFGMDFAWDIDLLSGYNYRIFNKDANFHLSKQIKVLPKLLTWAVKDKKTPLLLVGWFAEIIWLVWLLRILVNAPVMVWGDNTPQSFSANPKPLWRMNLLRWLLHSSAAVFYVGKRNRDFWIELGVPVDRLFYTPHSIDHIRFTNEKHRLLPQRKELCHRYGLNPQLPTFLFCGKLIPIKRVIPLLEAYLSAGLQDQAQLLFVGEGLLRSEIETRIKNSGLKNVHVLGFLNQSQMPLAYVLGEILCLVSESETWGLVVNEALACGRPVIVSETVGCGPDLVGPENGWIVPLDDHDRLTQTLLAAFEKRNLWAGMGQVGRKKVSTHTFVEMARGVKSALL